METIRKPVENDVEMINLEFENKGLKRACHWPVRVSPEDGNRDGPGSECIEFASGRVCRLQQEKRPRYCGRFFCKSSPGICEHKAFAAAENQNTEEEWKE